MVMWPSVRIPTRLFASHAVAPLPTESFFNQQITTQLGNLFIDSNYDCIGSCWLIRALDASITTQKNTLESLARMMVLHTDHSDREAIEDYLEDSSVILLDACKGFLEKMENVHKYIDSLNVALHIFEGMKYDYEPCQQTLLARARDALQSCEAIKGRCHEMGMCSSGAKKSPMKKKPGQVRSGDSELSEMLRGSKVVASMVCKVLRNSLSYKSKRCNISRNILKCSRPSFLRILEEKCRMRIKRSSTGYVIKLDVLQRTIMAAQELRDQMNFHKEQQQRSKQFGIKVEELKRSCGELEGAVKALEGRVNKLYRHVISSRMALLGILSQC